MIEILQGTVYLDKAAPEAGGGGGDSAIKDYEAPSYTVNTTLFSSPVPIPNLDALTEAGTYRVHFDMDMEAETTVTATYIADVAAVKVSGMAIGYMQNLYVGPGAGDSLSIVRMGMIGEGGAITWADWAGNSLLEKQDKTLSSAITVGGVSQTTVEGALGAINTVAAAGLQNKTNYPNSNIYICPAETNNYGTSSSQTIRIDPRPAHPNYGISQYAAIVGYAAGPTLEGPQYRNVVAVGYQSNTGGNYNIAVGSQAYAVGGGTTYQATTAVGENSNSNSGTSIGSGTKSVLGVAIGRGYDSSHKLEAGAYGSIAIGIVKGTQTDDQVKASAQNAIQLGNGVNTTASTFQVYSYPMLDGTTGKIPMARLPIVQLTQADYDALVAGGTVDANTIYCIIPA